MDKVLECPLLQADLDYILWFDKADRWNLLDEARPRNLHNKTNLHLLFIGFNHNVDSVLNEFAKEKAFHIGFFDTICKVDD